MNLGELRTSVRRYLGESGRAGTWTDEELNAWINESCTEHAQRALSVRKTVYVSSLLGVQEYILPEDFGELMAVRFNYEGHEGTRGLTYITKQLILDWGYSGTNLGDPEFYYYYHDSLIGDIIGLFPIPNKPRIFERSFTGTCQQFTPMLTDRDARYPDVPTEFTNHVEFCIEAEDEVESIPTTDLDPCRVWCSQIDLFLRRQGHPYPGEIYLSLDQQAKATHDVLVFRSKQQVFRDEALALVGENESEIVHHISRRIPAAYIDVRPGWVPFDFTENPIEITEDRTQYEMKLRGDGDYLFPLGIELEDPTYVLRSFGGAGVLVGTERETAENGGSLDVAYFRMNRLRNDIEVEYYRNYCDPMEEDTDVPQVPMRYHHTIRKMTLEKAYLKGGFDMALSQRWGAEAASEIVLARTQAVIPTIGERLELRGKRRLLPNFQWDQASRTGRVRLR